MFLVRSSLGWLLLKKEWGGEGITTPVQRLSGRGAGSTPLPFDPPSHSIPSAAADWGIITPPLARPYSLIFAAYCCFSLQALGEIPFIKFITCYLAGPNVISASFAFGSWLGWTRLTADWLLWKNSQASIAELSFTAKQGQQVACSERWNDRCAQQMIKQSN